MSELFAYICTRTTADPYLPPAIPDIRILARDVSDAFVALSGGHQIVGQLRFFPVQRAVPYHLLCDGREVAKTSFPELWNLLGETQGTPVDTDNFVLPSFIGAAAFDPAPAAQTETEDQGTVTTPPPTDPSVPNWDPDVYYDVESGGKVYPPWFIP